MGWHNGRYVEDPKFSDIVGMTLVAVRGLSQYSDEVIFEMADGRKFKMLHHQSCCESVQLEDFEFDANMLGKVITLANEETSSEWDGSTEEYESATWTFYNLSTTGGTLSMRWLG